MKKSKELSMEERREVLKKLAAKHNFYIIVEDDVNKFPYDGSLHKDLQETVIGILVHKTTYDTVEVTIDEVFASLSGGVWSTTSLRSNSVIEDIPGFFDSYCYFNDLKKLVADKGLKKICRIKVD